MPLSGVPPEPWHSFLRELDARLDQDVSLCCIGGFAFRMLYGLERPTADIDFLSFAPGDLIPHVLELAGQASTRFADTSSYSRTTFRRAPLLS